jgi:RNA polymerase sigma-70 factor (ECF subfamily)
MIVSRTEFSTLALAELDAVHRVARSLSRDASEADDLVQETYLRALRAQPDFELRHFGIRPWLLRILHNTHLNRVKKNRRQPMSLEAETLESVAPASPDVAMPPAPPGTIDDEELKQALSQLPPDLRTILILWAVEELSYKEMADVLDVPVGTVMSRIHRARQKIYRLMPKRRDLRVPGAPGGNGEIRGQTASLE